MKIIDFIADFRLNVVYLLKKDKSQFGEQDLLQRQILRQIPGGRKVNYLELGAFMPVLFSNSWCLKRMGKGFHIDANPNLKIQWRIFRPFSKYETAAISIGSSSETIPYFAFRRRHAGLNTFVYEETLKWQSVGLIPKEIMIQTKRVEDIVFEATKYLGSKIDLILSDIEGLDLSVIRTILDRNLCSPTWIIAEDHDDSVEDYLISKGFQLKGLAGPSKFFEREIEKY
jgi:hypothetical protein